MCIEFNEVFVFEFKYKTRPVSKREIKKFAEKARKAFPGAKLVFVNKSGFRKGCYPLALELEVMVLETWVKRSKSNAI